MQFDTLQQEKKPNQLTTESFGLLILFGCYPILIYYIVRALGCTQPFKTTNP